MKSLERVQKIMKVLHVLAVIAFVCSIVGAVCSLISSICFGVWGKDESIIELITNAGGIYDYDKTLCVCICTTIFCSVGIPLYYMIKNFYKTELELGTPFHKTVVAKARKVGVWRIVLPLLSIITVAVIQACFGVSAFNASNASEIIMGIVFLIVSCILEYGIEKK